MNKKQGLELRLHAIRLAAEGIHTYEFAHPHGKDLPAYEAGAHIDVRLPGGMMRSYSLAGDPQVRSRWTLAVLRDPIGRGGSRVLHEYVRVGDKLHASVPRNGFSLHPAGEHSILVAGGIGITPLKSMAHTLAMQGRSFELHYCARTESNAAFTDVLRELVPSGRLHFHYDDGDPTRGLDIQALLAESAGNNHVYYCGPEGFMKACADATDHWPQEAVHCEHFTTPEPERSSAVTGGFEVKLARSGASVQVSPDQSIVRAIELAGHRVPTSCMSGLCGACKVTYLEGEVDHRDHVLTESEKSHYLTVCCSRSNSPVLVLDL